MMFLDVSSLTNSVTMPVVLALTKKTDINAFDDGYDVVRQTIERIVSEFVDIAKNRAYTKGRFVYVHDDTLGDELTDIVLRELHKQTHIDGVVDILESTKRQCNALASAFSGDWNYRYYDFKK